MQIKLPAQAQEITDAFKNKGFDCYAVGGSVRDLLLGKKTSGWDFTTNAVPEEILKIFPDGFYDNKFGTVGILVGKDIFEITTYRNEKGYSDRRHPDKVTWGETLAEDLSRRDFTINAIAFDGRNLVDPFGGREDLQKKVVKAVGNPDKRFLEDALRLMRAVRIASELGFLIEKKTVDAVKKNAKNIQAVSKERVRDELLRILKSDHPADGILLLKNHGLLTYVLPELAKSFETPQKSPKRHHVYDVGTHLVESLRNCPSKDSIVRLATLLHDIGKPNTFEKTKEGIITFFNHEIEGTTMTMQIVKRLRLSKKDVGRIIRLVRWHQFSVDERQTDSALRRFIRRVGRENLDDILALRVGDRLGGGARETSWRLELFRKRLIEVQKQPFTVSDLQIDGHDVMKIFKIKPSPQVGEILEQIFGEVVENKLANKREVLLKRLKEMK